jgi:hypothetical protein
MLRLCTISVCIYFSSISLILSQRKFKQQHQVDGISITPSIGVGVVVGELGDAFSFKPIYGINIDKGVSEKINIGIGVVGGNLCGAVNEPYFSEFRSDYFQVQTLGILNISRYFITSYNKNVIELKIYGGVGMIWFHTDVYNLKNGKKLRATSENDSKHTTLFQSTGNGIGESGIYYTRELVIPVGFKVDYKLSDDVALNFDLGYNWVNNDKLDGATPYNILNPNIIAGVNSYSNTMNDGWINLSIGLKYTFSFKRGFIPRGV